VAINDALDRVRGPRFTASIAGRATNGHELCVRLTNAGPA
jgi:hypothetical protein